MSEPEQKKHSSPNDSFVKALASFSVILRDLPNLIPVEVAREIAPGSIELEPGSYVDDELKASHSDLVFSCRFREEPGMLYFLFEHQTSTDPRMPLRTTGYVYQIANDWAKRHPEDRTIPAVIPIVFHQSEREWRGPIHLAEMVALAPELKEKFRAQLLNSGFILVELKDLEIGRLRAGLALKLGLSLMRAVVKDQQIEWIEENAKKLHELLFETDGPALLRLMLRYVFETDQRLTSVSTLHAIADRLQNNQTKGEIMTLAEALKEEGRQEGRREGQERHTDLAIREVQFFEQLLGRSPSSSERLKSLTIEGLERELDLLKQALSASRK